MIWKIISMRCDGEINANWMLLCRRNLQCHLSPKVQWSTQSWSRNCQRLFVAIAALGNRWSTCCHRLCSRPTSFWFQMPYAIFRWLFQEGDRCTILGYSAWHFLEFHSFSQRHSFTSVHLVQSLSTWQLHEWFWQWMHCQRLQ